MVIQDAIIIVGDTPIKMSRDDMKNFTGNIVLTKDKVDGSRLNRLAPTSANDDSVAA